MRYAYILILLLFSCRNSLRSEPINILTDVPSLLYFIRLYNAESASKSNLRANILYTDDIDEWLASNNPTRPDLLISKNLNQQNRLKTYNNLDLAKLNLQESFYESISAQLDKKRKPIKLLPIALEPALYLYNKNIIAPEYQTSISISFAELLTISKLSPEPLEPQAEQAENDSFELVKSRVAAEYLWKSIDFIDDAFIISGANLDLANKSEPLASRAKNRLKDILSLYYSNEELAATNLNSYDKELWEQNIRNELQLGKIPIVPVSISSYMDLASGQNSGIFILNQQNSFIMRAVLWGAMAKQTKAKKEAYAFLLWLLDAEKQIKVLDYIRDRGIRVNGFLEGISTIPYVNEQRLEYTLPWLEGRLLRIPFTIEEEYPSFWYEIKKNFIDWLVQSASRTAFLEHYSAWNQKRTQELTN